MKEADFDASSMPTIMQLLSTMDNVSLRFIGAFCLKNVFTYSMNRAQKEFKNWIE